MTQAKKFTEAIDFQNKYIAVNYGFADNKTEDEKIKFVADKFFGGALDKCKELVAFIKEKAGGLQNRNALLKAREDYIKSVEKEKTDAEDEYQKNIDGKVVEKAEENVGKAEKTAKKAKRKSHINTAFKIALLCLGGAILASGSFAILAPVINALTLILGGLSGASLMAVGLGVWYYAPKIKEWWNSKDKHKGKNRYLGNYFQEESENAQKALEKASSELKKERGVRTALEADANKKSDEFQKVEEKFKHHSVNPVAREEINKLIKSMVDGQKLCEANPTKNGWATTRGKQWLKYGIARLEKAYATGKITDANYEKILKEYKDFFVERIFNPTTAVKLDPDLNRASAPGDDDARKFEETQDEFWA